MAKKLCKLQMLSFTKLNYEEYNRVMMEEVDRVRHDLAVYIPTQSHSEQ